MIHSDFLETLGKVLKNLNKFNQLTCTGEAKKQNNDRTNYSHLRLKKIVDPNKLKLDKPVEEY